MIMIRVEDLKKLYYCSKKMGLNHLPMLVFFLLSAIVQCECVENEVGSEATGVFDYLINKTLESLRPSLAELRLENLHFETGPQEFGTLNGNFKKVMVEGLENFKVKVINVTFFDLNNLTLEENFCAKGFYHLNGTLAFPLGKSDIQLFGDGQFSAKFTNLSVSVKMKIRFDNGTKIIRDFDIVVGLDKIQVYLKNLMGGGDLERVFNQLMNDVGLTIFSYYREPVLNSVKFQIIKIITDLLNKEIKSNVKVEL